MVLKKPDWAHPLNQVFLIDLSGNLRMVSDFPAGLLYVASTLYLNGLSFLYGILAG